VLPEYTVPSRPLYVIYPPGLQSVRKLRVFLDYIAEWFRRFPIDSAVTLSSLDTPEQRPPATTADAA
jgi:hypothetical protein